MSSSLSSIPQQLHDETELEGFVPGTIEFEYRLVAKRVEKCQAMQGVSMCSSCRAYDGCGLIRQHLFNIKFPAKTPKEDP